MAIVSSGQVSLNDIQTEFGGENPIGLSEYYGKGNAPASGEIQIASDFYGTSAGGASVHEITIVEPASGAYNARIGKENACDGDDFVFSAYTTSNLTTNGAFSYPQTLDRYWWKVNLANGNADWSKKVSGPTMNASNVGQQTYAEFLGGKLHTAATCVGANGVDWAHYVIDPANGNVDDSKLLSKNGVKGVSLDGWTKISANQMGVYVTNAGATNNSHGVAYVTYNANSATPTQVNAWSFPGGLTNVNSISGQLVRHSDTYASARINSINNPQGNNHYAVNFQNGQPNASGIGRSPGNNTIFCNGPGKLTPETTYNYRNVFSQVGNNWKNRVTTYYTAVQNIQNFVYGQIYNQGNINYGVLQNISTSNSRRLDQYGNVADGKIVRRVEGNAVKNDGNYVNTLNEFCFAVKFASANANTPEGYYTAGVAANHVIPNLNYMSAGQGSLSPIDGHTNFLCFYQSLSSNTTKKLYVVKWKGNFDIPTGTFTNSGLTISYVASTSFSYRNQGSATNALTDSNIRSGTNITTLNGSYVSAANNAPSPSNHNLAGPNVGSDSAS